jgi:citrate synthase
MLAEVQQNMQEMQL